MYQWSLSKFQAKKSIGDTSSILLSKSIADNTVDNRKVVAILYPRWSLLPILRSLALTNRKKCSIRQNRHKKLKPGLVASYDIWPGNSEGFFWFQYFINVSLTYLVRHLPTYSRPRDPHGAFARLKTATHPSTSCSGRESNSQPMSHKSNALTSRLLSHGNQQNNNNVKIFFFF